MKSKKMKVLLITCFSFILLSINACTTSIIMPDNKQFAEPGSKNFAMVYILRPTLQRTRGIADNDLTVEFGEHQLVTLLSAGEYVAFKVKPGAIDIITRNETYLTAKPNPKIVWRARNFTFDSGKNYFIEAKFTQEEFRGIYFIPKEIDLAKAKSYLNRIKPAGNLAVASPISSI